MAKNNYKAISELEEKIAIAHDNKIVDKFNRIICASMCAVLLAVGGSVFTMHATLDRFERDAMNEINYTRNDIAVLNAKINDLSVVYDEPEQVIEIAENGVKSEERELIERVVSAEARGESYEGIIAVAQTIKDRGDYWCISYTDVVNAPNQYASAYEGEVPEIVEKAVADVFDNGVRAFEEPTTHFHNSTVSPNWASAKTYRGQIGNHYFYG